MSKQAYLFVNVSAAVDHLEAVFPLLPRTGYRSVSAVWTSPDGEMLTLSITASQGDEDDEKNKTDS